MQALLGDVILAMFFDNMLQRLIYLLFFFFFAVVVVVVVRLFVPRGSKYFFFRLE